MNKKPTLVKKSQGLFSKLREIRDNDQGIVTFHFEEKTSFNDYKGKDTNAPVETEEVGRKWTVQQPINKSVFFTDRGKPADLENVVQLFKDLADDMGAKYFTI